MLWQYGSCRFVTVLVWHDPGAALVVLPARYDGGNSPWPTLMPPDSVPELLPIRLLAICRLWPQPCTKMPPPPCELLRMPRPSMLDGLHVKLLGKGLAADAVFEPQEATSLASRVVPVGNPASNVGSKGFWPWKSTPFDSTVIAAPSSAPISEGSCKSSARLPFRLASQP